MKKSTLIFVTVLTFVLNTKAQDMGKISIRNGNKAYPGFIASLNGVRLTNDYTQSITFHMLDEYQYRLKILQAGSSSILSFTLASEPKYLSKYLIMKDNFGNYAVMLESKSLMLDDQEPPTQTLVPTTTTSPVSSTTIVTTKTITSTQPTVAPTITITAISSADFNDRLNAVKKANFDRDKIEKVKQVFEEEYLTTNQVGEIVKIFPFDDDKMSVAQWCYKRTLDKKNYFKVEDQFSFDRYKKQLGDWVSKQPK